MLKPYNNKTILLVGAGYMAVEYVKVLKSIKIPVIVVGRGKKSARQFENETGIPVIPGGIKKWLASEKTYPPKAIVAVTENELGKVTRELIKKGVKSILVEKPGGLTVTDIKQVGKLAKEKKAKIYIAYNRRFYASVKKAVEIIKKDKGVKSFIFDFTELSHRIAPVKMTPGIKKNWFLANSTHVIDMAFFLGGWPQKITSYKKGKLNWHPKGSIYSGAGITKKGALFSYHANWESAGRWSIEAVTPKNKLIFRPLEKLQIQRKGSMSIEEISIDDRLDKKFKPGLYLQVKSFLSNKKNLPTIEQQIKNIKYYNLING